MAMMNIRDILTFHEIDRVVFDKVISSSDRTPRTARSIVAVWMWLKLLGVDVISRLSNCKDNSVLSRYVREAEAILDCLRQDSPPPADRITSLPLTAALVAEPLTLRFFYCHRDVAVRGISQIMDGVGSVIFNDELYKVLRAYESSARGAQLPLPPELAKRYPLDGCLSTTPEDSRSMFITFSKGHPLTEDEIISYFTEKWGQCVVKMMIERTTPGVLPMYGRVVLTSESLIDLVLGREHLVKFVVNGRQLWARKYVSRSGRA